MAYLGWLCLGGVEIVSDCRTLQRVSDGAGPEGIQCRSCDPCCPDLSAGLGYPDGYNPTTMPWYDGTQDSVDFAGLLIENIEGLEPGQFTRPITESAGYGAVLGQGRQSAPTVTVTALVLGATCCATEFGLQWLRSALRGCPTCAGDDLLFLSCEPMTPDLDCPDVPLPFDYEAWLAPYYRTLKGAALISGPTVIERVPRACPDCAACGIPRVQFTLAASKPCVYHDPIDIETAKFFVCDEDEECGITWVTPQMVAEGVSCEECPEPDDCATDPDCANTILPPAVPAIVNPCTDDCIAGISCSVCFDIPAGTFPSNGEGTAVITIDNTAGDIPVRSIKVQVWRNPLDLDPDNLGECDACSEINVSYVAPGARLIIDGANQTSTVECPGGVSVRANQFISSGTNAPNFSYPSMDSCSGQHTICVRATGPVSPEAFVTVQAVGREC